MAARIRERDEAREVAGWRQGDEYYARGYQRRIEEAWRAAEGNAEEILRWQKRAEELQEVLLSCLKKHESERAASFEEGMRSVLRQRCIEHRDVPQLNENAHGVGECGACVQDFWRNTYASGASWNCEERRRFLDALKVVTDALTVARGWAMEDADAQNIAAALKLVVTVRADAEDTFAPKVD